jgi:hypothetical protein
MKLSITFGLALVANSLFSQAPPITWQKCLGGYCSEEATDIQHTSDGGLIVCGFTCSNDGDVSGWHGLYDFWVAKLNASGSIIWQKCLGGTQHDDAYTIQQTSDGGYIVSGVTNSNDGDVSGNHGNLDIWVVKLNSSGTITWQKCLGGSADEWISSIQQTSDGGYIVSGNTYSNDGDVSGNHGINDCWVVKLNSSGAITWQKCLGGSAEDGGGSIQQTSDGGYIVCGSTASNNGDVSGNHGGEDFWVIKLNATGSITWQKCLGGTAGEGASSIQQTSDGGYIVSGSTGSNDGDVSGNHGSVDIWVVKLNSSGSITWQKCLGGTGEEYGTEAKQTSDGGYIQSGYTNSNDGDVSGNHGWWEAWVAKLNSLGSITWQKCLGGTMDEFAYAVQETSDNGFIVAGSSSSNNGDVSGNHTELWDFYDWWIVKLASSACPTFNATGTVTNATCYGSPNGSININPPNNGSPPYTYVWSNGTTTEDINNIGAGTYSLTISDGINCATAFNFNVTSPPQILISFTSVPVACYGASNGTLTASPSGGVPGYSYLWSTGANTITINNLAAGTYALTVTDANSCTKTSSFSLMQPDQLIVTINSQNVSCFGGSNGIASANPAGGIPGYTYIWSNGATTSSIYSLPAATYFVTVTDLNGCTAINTITISEPPLLTLTTSSQNVSCFEAMNGSAMATASGGSPGYSYIWSNGASGSTINNLNPGTYTVTVIDTHACTKTSTVAITGPSALVLMLNGANVSCLGDSDGWINAAVSGGVGGYTYLWTNGMTSDSIGNLSAGTFGLTATDASGCTNSSTYEVLSPGPLELNVFTTDVSSAGGEDGSASAEVEGGTPLYSYLWSTGEITDAIFNLPAGNYSVTVTDDHGCTEVAFFTITEPDCGLSVLVSTTPIFCYGGSNGSATANFVGGNGNVEYLWSNGETSQSINDLSAGTYLVTVSDDGCTVFSIAVLADPPQIMAQVNALPTTCNDSIGSAQVMANGGTGTLEYLWSNGESTMSIDNLSQGIYTVTVTDANSCSHVWNALVAAIDTVAPVQLQVTDTLYINSNGILDDFNSLQNNFMDECGDFNINLLNMDSLLCTDMIPDTLEVMVTDLSGNDTIYEVLVTILDTIRPQIIGCPPNIEQGSCQGEVYFEVPFAADNCQLDTFYQTAGFPPGTEFPIGSTLNEWLAIDRNGNTQVCSFIVTITEGIVLQAQVHPISCRNQNDASISIDTSNIVPPFSILWNTGDSTTSLHDLAEGNYSVTLTDANGCQAIDTIQVVNPEYLYVTLLEVHDVTAPDSSNGSIIISVSGGTPPYTYAWIRNDTLVSTDQNPLHLASGTYMLLLTDAHNCAFVGNEVIIGVVSSTSYPVDPTISIFPNPVSNILNIVSDQIIDSYEIIDIKGETIRSEKPDAYSWRIELADEMPGIYLLATHSKRKMQTIKFLIIPGNGH